MRSLPNIKCRVSSAFVAALLTIACAGAAQATGIVTTVTVKNSYTSLMTFYSANGQILGAVNPNPPSSLAANIGQTTFTVTSGVANTAAIHFYYQNVGDKCKFDTSYTTGGGYTSAGTASGDVPSCSASITATNPTTHDYSITFTLN